MWFVSSVLPPGREELKGDEADRIIGFKNSLGIDDPDAANMHMEIGRKIFRQRLEVGDREGDIEHRRRRKTSVLLDATEYIQGLKQKLEELNRLQVATEQKIVDYDPMPKLKVEAEEEGLVIKVESERSCQGLLVFILEAFEELGLDVLQARVSCADNFSLEAAVNGNKEENINQDTGRPLDAQLVEQVVSQAIQNWKEATRQ